MREMISTTTAAGCGRSEGDYITLGWREEEDVMSVRDHLSSMYGIQRYGLWGQTRAHTSTHSRRPCSHNTVPDNVTHVAKSTHTSNLPAGRSMGAVAALKHAALHAKQVQFLVLDSPYCNLWTLAQHVLDTYLKRLPAFVSSNVGKVTLPVVRKQILKRLPDFDIGAVSAITPTRTGLHSLPRGRMHMHAHARTLHPPARSTCARSPRNAWHLRSSCTPLATTSCRPARARSCSRPMEATAPKCTCERFLFLTYPPEIISLDAALALCTAIARGSSVAARTTRSDPPQSRPSQPRFCLSTEE